jgi:hypothetical protein
VQVAVKPSNFYFLLSLFVVGVLSLFVVGVRVRDRELTCIFAVFFLAGNCIIWGILRGSNIVIKKMECCCKSTSHGSAAGVFISKHTHMPPLSKYSAELAYT